VIRVYDDVGNVIETHEYANDSNKHAALPEFGRLGDPKLSAFLTVLQIPTNALVRSVVAHKV
jgi:hypothetical protein